MSLVAPSVIASTEVMTIPAQNICDNYRNADADQNLGPMLAHSNIKIRKELHTPTCRINGVKL